VYLEAYPRLTTRDENNLDEESGVRFRVAGQATLNVWEKKEWMHSAVMTRRSTEDVKQEVQIPGRREEEE
jgi:hypothetical protein